MALMCPYPHVDGIILTRSETETPTAAGITTNQRSDSKRNCDYAFSRAYDLRRHLKTAHGLLADKESVDQWVKGKKSAQKDV
jgi:general transcription factor IIIA